MRIYVDTSLPRGLPMADGKSYPISRSCGAWSAALPEWLQFLLAFASQPRHVGSPCSGSRALQRRLAALAAVPSARVIVELGPGLGAITRVLLEGMSPKARLIAIEIVPAFVEQLRTIRDPRLEVVQGSALHFDSLLKDHDAPQLDVVVSGIPFSGMSYCDGRTLLQQVHDLLLPGGAMIAYQFRNRAKSLADGIFGPSQRTFLPWNIPPLWIDEWRKPLS